MVEKWSRVRLLANTDSSFLNNYAEVVFDSCRYFPKFQNSSSDKA